MNNVEEKVIVCPDCHTMETIDLYKDRFITVTELTFGKFHQDEEGNIYHCITVCRELK